MKFYIYDEKGIKQMDNTHKKLISGMLIFMGGMIPFSLWWIWFPCLFIGWLLLYNWVD